jgi:hypothetical protein
MSCTHASMWDSTDGKPAKPGMTACDAVYRSIKRGRMGSKFAKPNWRCRRDMAVWKAPAAMCSAASCRVCMYVYVCESVCVCARACVCLRMCVHACMHINLEHVQQ